MKNINEYINEALVNESSKTYYYVTVGSEDSIYYGWIYLDENGKEIDKPKITDDIEKVSEKLRKNIQKGLFKSYKKDEDGDEIDRIALLEGDDPEDTSDYDFSGEYDLYGRLI